MKMINLRNLQFLFMPSYWIMNYPYSQEVDDIINDLLKKHECKNLDKNEFTFELGKAIIWAQNRPYGFGRIDNYILSYHRPSRLTIKRLIREFSRLRKEKKDNEVKRLRKEFGL